MCNTGSVMATLVSLHDFTLPEMVTLLESPSALQTRSSSDMPLPVSFVCKQSVQATGTDTTV